jgi:undecaprenyl-diphosphatase
MPLYHIFILSIIQGITEFLPISSSAHLVLAHDMLGINSLGTAHDKHELTIDIAVHLGTLIAVIIYFRKDVLNMVLNVSKGKENHHLLKMLIIASLPVIFAGYFVHALAIEWFRSIEIIAWCTIIFAILLWHADKNHKQSLTIEKDLTLKNAFIIGVVQSLALIPGVSRSGVTMTAGRYLGFGRTEAARFSLLLSIIAISGAGFLGAIDLYEINDIQLGLNVIIATILSAISGYIAISLMIRWLTRATFLPFVIYRLVLGVVLLSFIYF